MAAAGRSFRVWQHVSGWTSLLAFVAYWIVGAVVEWGRVEYGYVTFAARVTLSILAFLVIGGGAAWLVITIIRWADTRHSTPTPPARDDPAAADFHATSLAGTVRAVLPSLIVQAVKMRARLRAGQFTDVPGVLIDAPSGFAIEVFVQANYWYWRESAHAYLASEKRQPSSIADVSISTDRLVALVAAMVGTSASRLIASETGFRSTLAEEELASSFHYLEWVVRTTRDPELRGEALRYLESLGA